MASKFGEVVDIDDLLDRSKKNRVNRIGIELEGGWNRRPPDIRRIIRDGSIRNLTACEWIGEMPSPVLLPGTWEDWMKLNYPDVTNASCGLHVHMSFSNALHYMQCMSPKCPATVVEYIRRWATEAKLPADHPIWERLAGNSRYCQHIYAAEEQITNSTKDYDQERTGHRYTALNFAYGRTGTLECRMLPMMADVEQGISAVRNVINVINCYLLKTAKKSRSAIVDVAFHQESEAQYVRKIFI